MRIKLDKSVVERDMAVEGKRMMEERIKTLNVGGAELLISQIKELQKKDGVFHIVNGEIIPRVVDEYKMKYEKAVKERDLLRLKIRNLASAASSSLALLGMETDDADGTDADGTGADGTDPASNNHPQETSTLNPGNGAVQAQTTPASRHTLSAPSVQVVNHHTSTSHPTQTTPSTPLLSIPNYSQTLQPAFHGWQVM